MTRLMTFASALTVLATGTAVSLPASAAAPPIAGFVGEGASSVAGCPFIQWRLARHPDGQVTGIAYYSDMSGVSMVTGTVTQAGQFNLTLTSAMGQGPTGTVSGTKSRNGALNATMTGEGCANMKLHISPVANLNLSHSKEAQ